MTISGGFRTTLCLFVFAALFATQRPASAGGCSGCDTFCVICLPVQGQPECNYTAFSAHYTCRELQWGCASWGSCRVIPPYFAEVATPASSADKGETSEQERPNPNGEGTMEGHGNSDAPEGGTQAGRTPQAGV